MSTTSGARGLAAHRPTRRGSGDAVRGTQRDLLPVPRVSGEFILQERSHSRALRQRVRRTQHQHVFVEVIFIIVALIALNSLAGKPDGCRVAPSRPRAEAIARLEAVVRAAQRPAQLDSPEEAVHARFSVLIALRRRC